jgi:hypothetical protein
MKLIILDDRTSISSYNFDDLASLSTLSTSSVYTDSACDDLESLCTLSTCSVSSYDSLSDATPERKVTFGTQLVTEVWTRKKTLPEDVPSLYYSELETKTFRQEYRLEKKLQKQGKTKIKATSDCEKNINVATVTQPSTTAKRQGGRVHHPVGPSHSSRPPTELIYLKEETITTPVTALASEQQSVVDRATPNHNDLLRLKEGIRENISYDAIQKLVDVSRPYYNLQNEQLVKDATTGMTTGFAATVTPEMPLSYESGTMTASEAGRHTAIAGSVAASLLNQEQLGCNDKNYYVVLDAHLRQESLDLETIEAFDGMPALEGEAKVFARATNVNQRDASAEVYLLTPDDNTLWHISVTYKIIHFRVFDKFFPLGVDSSLAGPWNPATTPNPHCKNIVTRRWPSLPGLRFIIPPGQTTTRTGMTLKHETRWIHGSKAHRIRT